MEGLNPTDLEKLFAAKEARRQKLATASFPEKIMMLVRLQEMAAPILNARGIHVRPWKIAPPARVAKPRA
ncbi:MAG: hypothetical protein HUU16_00635 [Candidatus Omnitrophica bacterium]|nr:hypothetical protein [bacterium]NUN94655.1 hypothetical protein [Candidatus Omnitrophota bacterium]